MSSPGSTAPQAAATPTPTMPRPHFADNEEFDLTLDHVVAPLDMVANDGYGNPKKWKFHGKAITVPVTGRFKWVAVGSCSDLDEVKAKLKPHGTIPGGQWREAIKANFTPDGQHPRGIADDSWGDPHGDRRFPFVREDGDSRFRWTDDDLDEFWRWLVEVPKAEGK